MNTHKRAFVLFCFLFFFFFIFILNRSHRVRSKALVVLFKWPMQVGNTGLLRISGSEQCYPKTVCVRFSSACAKLSVPSGVSASFICMPIGVKYRGSHKVLNLENRYAWKLFHNRSKINIQFLSFLVGTKRCLSQGN